MLLIFYCQDIFKGFLKNVKLIKYFYFEKGSFHWLTLD